MKHSRLRLWPLLLALLLLCGGCAVPVQVPPAPSSAPAIATDNSETAPPLLPAAQIGELRLIFFDVGQADSILISADNHHMLVDAGDTGQDALLTGYLQAYGVSKLDYLVATHPHADHIGAMAAVVYAMDSIGAVLMPDIIATTTVFEKLLDAIDERNLEITVPQAGDILPLGAATVQVIAPVSSGYQDMNDYSIVLRVSFGQTSFLLTGDAEAISEAEQLAGGELKADVLKVGHHGSSSSSTAAYLDAVAPSYAVVSCGLGNSYGHPHNEVLARLAERSTTVYRTDEWGTVVIVTDGQSINITTTSAAPTDIKPADSGDVNTAVASGYIGNRNSQIFHLPTCSTLPAEHNRVLFESKDEAIEQGYRACKACKP